MNGFQDSLSSYPHWITNWKNSYLEVEEDCTLHPSTLSNNTITYAYCKTKDKTEPIQINL
ncbi:hypothetical protein [Mycoplasma wenyonii]|nr:hypothetical protein [Mycoplasma wenyonii]